MTRALLVAAAGAAIVALGGCRTPPPPPTRADDPRPARGDEGVAWPYWPTRMRIHPLTRIARDPELDRTVVEARLEFFDRDGNTTRCYGYVNLTLDVPLPDDASRPVSTWSVDLRDPRRNANLFDPVTRTYLFKLDYGAPRSEVPTKLTAEYIGADGTNFEVEYTVPED